MAVSIITYWPIIAMGTSLGLAGGAGYIDLRLNDQSLDAITVQVVEDIEDNGESIDTNEEAIEAIQRLLISRQGRIDLDVQKLQNDIDKQDIKLDQLLLLLQQLRDSSND